MERKGRPGIIRRVWGGFWAVIEGLRRWSLNLVFLLLLVILGTGWWSGRSQPLATGTALLIAPNGELVEQRTLRNAVSMLQGGEGLHQVLMRDLIEAIRKGATDTRISHLVLETDGLRGASLGKLQELGAALAEFRKTGKPVYAYGRYFDQSSYYLAAQADQVFLNPDGFVYLSGFGRFPTYYKGLFDQLGVKVQVFRVGTYKSFVEPYTRSDMSEADRESTRSYLDEAWKLWQQDVQKARPALAKTLPAYLEHPDEGLAAVQGDGARYALDAGLVDGIKSADEWRDFLKDKGQPSEDGKSYRHLDLAAYVGRLHDEASHTDAKVGVVVAQGAIMDGEQPSGTVGGDTVAALIRQARESDDIKAVVLRVDSPGGSATASEVIRRELALTRKAGKPVIVSMGSVAASGGYWISMAADEVWANPATITGSIGIFAMLPDLSGPMGKLGLTVDGVGTTPLAGSMDVRRPVSPMMGALLQQSIEHGYRRFLGVVGEARGLSPEAVDGVAQGRVWLGTQARERKLVDQLGGLHEAVAAAAQRAKLERYEVSYVEKNLSPRDQLLARLLDKGEEGGAGAGARATPSLLTRLMGRVEQEFRGLAEWNDPGNAYVHCLCTAP